MLDFVSVADLLGIEVAVLKAVQQVETGGRGGFLVAGKPAILFEGHIFWRELKRRGMNPENFIADNEDILYPKWAKGYYKGGMREYVRLEKARKIHKEAADASTSWGMFQIMGFNYAACGYDSVGAMVNAMCISEDKQLEAFARFIQKLELIPYLKVKDWKGFARKYNRAGYAKNSYDKKLEAAYRRFADQRIMD